MLKAGVMDGEVNEEETPQDGLISPLLANAYLDIMDERIAKQWESKQARYPYKQQRSRCAALKKNTTLIAGYMV